MTKPLPTPEPQPLNPDEWERVETVKSVIKAGGPEAAKMLAAALADPVEGFRKLVADSLVAVGPSALATLADLVTDVHAEIRRWACEVMGRLNSTTATGALLIRLTDPDPAVRAAAAEALGNLGDKRGVDPLVWMSSNDQDERCRVSATWALRMIGAVLLHSHLPFLRSPDLEARLRTREAVVAKGKGVSLAVADLLKDEDPTMRLTAAEILGKLADERTLDDLVRAMGDSDVSVRSAVVQALSGIRTDKAVAVLVGQLQQGDARIASEAAAALVGQGNLAVPALVELLNSDRKELQVVAADLLGRLRDTRATQVLLAVLNSADPEVRVSASRALGAIRDASAAGGLLKALDDPAPEVRAVAAQALGELKALDALSRLLTGLETDEMPVRVAAARALGQIADPVAFSRLVDAMDSQEPELRSAAIEALGELRDKRVVPFLKKIARPWPFSREPEQVKASARIALTRLLHAAAAKTPNPLSGKS